MWADECPPAGLDLSGEDTDAAAMLPARAVQRLDPPPYVLEERPDTPSFFLCLGADNRRVGAVPDAHVLACQLDECARLRVDVCQGEAGCWPLLFGTIPANAWTS